MEMTLEEQAKARDNKYQHALNDVISNAGTKFNCKNDSFYLLQELVDKYSFGKLIEVSE